MRSELARSKVAIDDRREAWLVPLGSARPLLTAMDGGRQGVKAHLAGSSLMENSSQTSKARERLTALDAEVARRVWRAGVHQTAEPARRQKQAPAGVAFVRSDSAKAVDWVRLLWPVGGRTSSTTCKFGAFSAGVDNVRWATDVSPVHTMDG